MNGWLYWDSLAEFAAMGGHALYVWGAYGAAAAALGAEAWLVLRRARRARAAAEARR
jgi:heme exporter protein D